jgi:hypothetical protein
MKIPFAVNYGDEMKYTHHAPPSEIWTELQNDIDIGRLYSLPLERGIGPSAVFHPTA